MFIGSASKHHTNTVLTHHPPSLNCLGVEKPCGIDNVFDTMKTNFDIDLKVGYAIMNRAKVYTFLGHVTCDDRSGNFTFIRRR